MNVLYKQIKELEAEVKSLHQQLAAKEHEFQQAKEAIAHLEKGRPLGELVGKQTIVNQAREISDLKEQLAARDAAICGMWWWSRARAEVQKVSALARATNVAKGSEDGEEEVV